MTEKFDPKSKITKMQGKDYLEVKWRVVWFREDHPKGSIVTEVAGDDLMKATVSDGDGRILATGHGSSKKMGVAKSRPFEGAETAAIGRALAHAGYGTQFTDEDEGTHLADSPVDNSNGNGHKPKRVWALQQKEAVVTAGYADNIHEAAKMLDHSVLKENSGEAVVTSWARYYRAARDEGKEVVEAAQVANEAYLNAKKAVA